MRLTARTIEIFLKGERIASHMRGSGNGHHTTINDHMPSSHRRYGDWTVDRLLDEAGRLGSSVRVLCEMILSDRPHPEQGYRSCLGILRLARPYGAARVDAASQSGGGHHITSDAECRQDRTTALAEEMQKRGIDF